MMRRLHLGELAGPREMMTVVLLAITVGICAEQAPGFLSALNVSFILTDAVEIGLIALPMTMVIVMGEIDLSVGSTVGLSAAVLGDLVLHQAPFVLALLVALLVGALAGFVNGLLCTTFQMPSLVLTLGTFALYRGLAEVVIGSNSVNAVFPSWFNGWNNRYMVGLITYPQVFLFASCIVAVLILHRTRFGRHIMFIGSNPVAARFSGLPLKRAKILLFTGSGVVSAVAALILVSRLQSLDNTTGSGFELLVITAVLLGGADYRGGRGTILGSVLAVLLVSTLEDGLEILGVSAQATTAVIGALLILSIVLARAEPAVRRLASRRRSGGRTAGGAGPKAETAQGPSAPGSGAGVRPMARAPTTRAVCAAASAAAGSESRRLINDSKRPERMKR